VAADDLQVVGEGIATGALASGKRAIQGAGRVVSGPLSAFLT
jgi:hypothetical protein